MLVEKARELGLMIAGSSEFLRMNSAKQAVVENEALSALLDEFTQKRDRLVSCLADADGDSGEAVSLTDDIDRLRTQLTENPLISELTSAEEAFSTLLASINAEINACIGQSGCSHDCSHCGSCVH